MSFQDILSKQASEVKKPPPYPVGTYLAQIEGPGKFDKIGKDQTDIIDFQAKLLQPGEDVDQASLADYQEKTGNPVAGKTARVRFFLTEAAAWRLKDFLVETLGIPEVGSLGELIPQASGKQLYVTIKHAVSQDGQNVYSEIGSTAKV